MGHRHPNPGLVKIHRSYKVDEIARLLGVHKNTVRHWLKLGLEPIDGQRPTLVYGQVLVNFLRARRRTARTHCPPGFLYCVRCRAAREPAGNMAELLPMTATSGNLRAICPVCETLIHRRVSLAKLTEVKGTLEVTVSQALLHIGDSPAASVNCDFDPGADPHVQT